MLPCHTFSIPTSSRPEGGGALPGAISFWGLLSSASLWTLSNPSIRSPLLPILISWSYPPTLHLLTRILTCIPPPPTLHLLTRILQKQQWTLAPKLANPVKYPGWPSKTLKLSQNNPLRPKRGTFCRQNVTFIADRWRGLGGGETQMEFLFGLEMPNLLAFVSTQSLKAGKTPFFHFLLQFRRGLIINPQLASEIDPWRYVSIWPQRLRRSIGDFERRGQKFMSLANNLTWQESHVLGDCTSAPVSGWCLDPRHSVLQYLW